VVVRPTSDSVTAFGTPGEAQVRAMTLDLDAANPTAVYRVAGRRSRFGFALRSGTRLRSIHESPREWTDPTGSWRSPF
jgi:hypothetical protein